jgi:hypothetical protein
MNREHAPEQLRPLEPARGGRVVWTIVVLVVYCGWSARHERGDRLGFIPVGAMKGHDGSTLLTSRRGSEQDRRIAVGLVLCILDEDGEDVAGFQVGHYSDFGCFRDTIARHIPDAASLYPLLMQHSDCDGEWSVDDLPRLDRELDAIGERFKSLPPEEPENAFEHVAHCREGASSLYDCFHNVDEENLFEALRQLCREGIELKRAISFQ